MRKNLLPLIWTMFIVTMAGVVPCFAANGIVKMKTDAPAGTSLRIQTNPYDNTIEGVEKGDFVGEFFSKGPGTEITVKCDNLGQLEVYGCQLTELTIVDAPSLYILKCYNNKLTSLDVSKCKELAILNCSENLLTGLDISACDKIEEVNASNNKLTEIKIGAKPLLKELNCGSNPLNGLDLTQCENLEELCFEKCGLSSLDLSNNKSLWWVFAFGNNLKDEAMDAFLANLPEPMGNGMLYIVDTTDKGETNVCTMDNVRAAAQKGWMTMDYTGGNGTDSLLGVFYPGCDYVPAVSEKTISLTTTRATGETIKLNIKTSDSIEISGIAETTNLTGEKTFTLTSQTVVIKGDVTSFECPDNDITALTFNDPSLLTYLDCKNNKIESLDMKGAKSLKTLYAQKNNLSFLNLADCNSLLRVDCYINNLTGSAMTAFMNSLCTSTAEPFLFVIDTKTPDNAEHNVATKKQVKIATDKGWKVFDFANGDRFGMGVAYEGSEDTRPTEFFTLTRASKGEINPSITFAVPLSSEELPEVEGGTVIGWNGTSLMIRMEQETVKVFGDVTSLQMLFGAVDAIDVTNLPNLTELNVALNNITTLDLSGNKKLESLSCEANMLESLDFGQCPAIDYVNCYGNRIKGQAMTQMMESLPARTREEYGTIIVRDASYGDELNVCLTTDVDIALKKYWVTCELDAESNAVQYDGVSPDGLANVSDDAKTVYEAADATIRASRECDITVYNLSGHTVAKASGADRLCIKGLPAGIYVVRAGGDVLKIMK